MTDKFERTGFHAIKSDHVDAPVIQEFLLTMECELLERAKSFRRKHRYRESHKCQR